MSLAASNAAWAAELSGTEKLVLLCLADHADKIGRCWPSIARMSDRCGLHRTSVMRSLQVLAQAGHIEVQHDDGQHNRYVVRQHSDADTSRLHLPVAKSDRSHTATSTHLKPVVLCDTTCSAEQPDQSLSAIAPVAQGDPNLLGTYQEPTMNPIAKKARVKHAIPKTPPFHQEIINAYHEICPDLPEIKSWTDGRRASLDARIAERAASGKPADTIDYWRAFLLQVTSSDFLCGRSGNWCADLAWLLKPENFAKTIEGRYDRARIANGAGAHG
jgi:hypothetical protein